MSAYVICPSSLSGHLEIPPSKSQTLRAILFASMATGKSQILNPLSSQDTDAMLHACRLFGAKIEVHSTPHRIEIEGLGGVVDSTEDVIQAHNSGIVLRFCSALGALARHPIVITGDHSIRHQRPMAPLIRALNDLGANVVSMRGDGFAPLIIQGPIRAGKTHIQGQDSQPVSALLIAGAFAEGPIEIRVSDPGEIPWIQMTLNWLQRLGIPYEQEGFTRYLLQGLSRYTGFTYTVPGDFSSAAFPIAGALVTQSEMTLSGLDIEDCQGDKALIDILRAMGAAINWSPEKRQLHIQGAHRLKGIEVDINPLIDALPILTVIACFAQGETVIKNGAIARNKESDRIHCIAKELTKMGAHIEETPDGLRIRESRLEGASLSSHQDHRLAMALTVGALGAKGETVLAGTDCVAKTYPSFFPDFARCGARLQRL